MIILNILNSFAFLAAIFAGGQWYTNMSQNQAEKQQGSLMISASLDPSEFSPAALHDTVIVLRDTVKITVNRNDTVFVPDFNPIFERDTGLLHTKVQIGDGNNILQFATVIFSIQLPGDLQDGDVLIAEATVRATHSFYTNVNISGAMLVTDSPIQIGSGQIISPANGFNITPKLKTGVFTKYGFLKCTALHSNMYANFYCYQYSDAVNESGPPVYFVLSEGNMNVRIYRKK